MHVHQVIFFDFGTHCRYESFDHSLPQTNREHGPYACPPGDLFADFGTKVLSFLSCIVTADLASFEANPRPPENPTKVSKAAGGGGRRGAAEGGSL